MREDCKYYSNCGNKENCERYNGYEQISMSKVKVFVEEHLCRELEIEVPDNMNQDDAMEYAENKVRKMVSNEEIILTTDDWNGVRLYCVEDENGFSTDWHK